MRKPGLNSSPVANTEEKMRILANLMIDRILEERRKEKLKFVDKSDNLVLKG